MPASKKFRCTPGKSIARAATPVCPSSFIRDDEGRAFLALPGCIYAPWTEWLAAAEVYAFRKPVGGKRSGHVVIFMLTWPRGVTIRDVVMLPPTSISEALQHSTAQGQGCRASPKRRRPIFRNRRHTLWHSTLHDGVQYCLHVLFQVELAPCLNGQQVLGLSPAVASAGRYPNDAVLRVWEHEVLWGGLDGVCRRH